MSRLRVSLCRMCRQNCLKIHEKNVALICANEQQYRFPELTVRTISYIRDSARMPLSPALSCKWERLSRSLQLMNEWACKGLGRHTPPGFRPGETYPAGLIFRTLKGERLPLRSDPEPSAALQDPAGWKPFKRGVSVKRNKGDYTLFFALRNYGR